MANFRQRTTTPARLVKVTPLPTCPLWGEYLRSVLLLQRVYLDWVGVYPITKCALSRLV